MKYIKIVFMVTILFSLNIKAQIFVSPNGDDSNPGTKGQPLKSIYLAISYAGPDSTIYLLGGQYDLSSTVNVSKNGEAGKYIKMWAYPGETPILDFSGQSYTSSSRGVKLAGDYWYIKGLVVRNAGDNGMIISGSYNIVENCEFYYNKDTGLQVSNGGSYNYIHICDSFENYDPATHGENADGFAPKLDVGPGNVFRSCRSWSNADDGWDFYEAQYEIVLDSCWSFRNGINIWGDTNYQGEGNGFKVCGNYVPTHHKLTNCVAFDNPGKGFDQNHNTAGVTIYNCTGYRNGKNYSFPETPSTGQDTLKNNLSYDSKSSVSIESSAITEKNSWQGFTVTDNDFASLDTSLAKVPRQSDSSLTNTKLFRLASGSSLIDAGVVVGIAYIGNAPDIGAFEYNPLTAVENSNVVPSEFKLEQNYPNPFNPFTIIQFSVPVRGIYTLKVFNILGQEISTLIQGEISPGIHSIKFKGSNLTSGIYIYRLIGANVNISRKMVLAK